MKRVVALFILLILNIFVWAQLAASDSYDVVAIYSVNKLPSGSIGLSRSDRSLEIDRVLIPIKIDVGTYSVYIKRIDSDLYEVVGKDIYIKTRFCYEYTYGDDVILKIESSYGYSIGELIFE